MEAVQKVLGNESLRETILHYVISDGDLENSDVKTCRLVQKSWLHSISRCFRVARKPLFNLKLANWSCNGQNAAVDKHQENLLDKFLNTFDVPSRLKNIPVFQLTVDNSFLLNHEDRGRLWEFLPLCGSSLVQLTIEFPEDGFKMPSKFPDLSFPLLRSFNIVFCESRRPRDTSVEKTNFGVDNSTSQLIQLILNGCSELKYISTKESAMGYIIVPLGYDDLQLPSTITELKFMDKLEMKQYNFLLQSDLPELRKLELTYSDWIGEPEVLHNILERVSGTLEQFGCYGTDKTYGQASHCEVTYYELPEMKKLKKLGFSVPCFELEEDLNCLHEKLPAVTNLHLTNQTPSSFRKWTAGSQYRSVKRLNTSLTTELDELESSCIWNISFCTESIKLLHSAFPNLEDLSISFDPIDMSALPTMFEHMIQLKTLDIQVNGDSTMDSDDWIALFLGIPKALAKTMRKDPESVNRLRQKVKKYSTKSLTNLSELRSFRLDFEPIEYLEDEDLIDIDPLPSIALLEMPNLAKCELGNTFEVYAETIENWQNAGRDLRN